MINYKKYSNGLRLIVNSMDGMVSVSCGVLIGAGSSLEEKENNGISHFIEHVNFKGTKTRTSFEISDAFDCLGAQVNAFTSKEMTCYYVKSITDSFEKSFELLSDLTVNSTYPEEELEREKDVVIEEINMSEDTPEDLCLDLLSESYFGQNGYGRTILGPAENVKSFGKAEILAYEDKFYVAGNIVVSLAGNITFEEADRLVTKYMISGIRTGKTAVIPEMNTENLCKNVSKRKEIEQVNIGLGFEGFVIDSKESNILSLINCAVGGGMSSRLFQKVREQLGLAYTIYSYPSGYKNCGTFAIFAGVNPKKTKLAFESIVKVLEDTKNEGLSEKEFLRGKAQLLSGFEFGEESSASQMMLYGKYLLYTDKVFNMKEKLSDLNGLTLEQTNETLRRMNFEKMSTSVIGKNVKNLI